MRTIAARNRQMEILAHSLGINHYTQASYRNYYNSDPTDDLTALVEAGFMVVRDAPHCSGSKYYHVTPEGERAVREAMRPEGRLAGWVGHPPLLRGPAPQTRMAVGHQGHPERCHRLLRGLPCPQAGHDGGKAMRQLTPHQEHLAFEARAMDVFWHSCEILIREVWHDYRQTALKWLDEKFGNLPDVARFERSIELLGKLAEARTGWPQVHALRLRDELAGVLAERRGESTE